MTVSDEHVAQVTAMGFSKDEARDALRISGGNVEAAINYILGGGAPSASFTSSATSAAEPLPRTVDLTTKAKGVFQCTKSQYSYEQGRSACTCIALAAASKFLLSPQVNPDFLEEMLSDGIKAYQQLSSKAAVEHQSAEEILQLEESKSLFPINNLGIFQGILSNDYDFPLGLKAMLKGRREEQPRDQWIAILVTKSPETVLLCFPPKTEPNPAFWLIDSHPRPQLGVDSAYAKLHASLDELWMSLDAIFPPTELGSDVPETMAMMYNSFDLYPLLIVTPKGYCTEA